MVSRYLSYVYSFYTPVFRRDVLWYGDVRPSGSPSVHTSGSPSVRPSDSPSIRLSVRPFSTLFSYMLWHIELKFCTSLCFNVLQIKFECRHFASIFLGVMPLLELEYRSCAVFRTFLLHALTYWAEILYLTLFYCATDQVRVSSIFVGVMPLSEWRILKIHSFLHFSLTRLGILSWQFCIWSCYNVIQIKFECHQFL